MSHECDLLRDDLAAYALGALDGADAARLERHLEGCESCRERLEWLAPAVDLLPGTVEQLTPPPRLKENLMATVRAEAAGAEKPVMGKGERGSWWASLRGLMLRPATGIAVLAVLVVGVGLGYALRGSGEPEPTLVEAKPLTDAAPVSVTLERSGDRGTLHVHQLPQIADDEVYEVWIERDGALAPDNTFVLDRDGTAEAAVGGSLQGGDQILVTREPRGGSRQPTTQPLLSVPL